MRDICARIEKILKLKDNVQDSDNSLMALSCLQLEDHREKVQKKVPLLQNPQEEAPLLQKPQDEKAPLIQNLQEKTTLLQNIKENAPLLLGLSAFSEPRDHSVKDPEIEKTKSSPILGYLICQNDGSVFTVNDRCLVGRSSQCDIKLS